MKACDVGRPDRDPETGKVYDGGARKPCPRPSVGYLAGVHVCVPHRRNLIARGAAWCEWAEIEWAAVNGHGPRSAP